MTSAETATAVLPFEALSRPHRRRLIAWATLRTLATTTVVVLIYYLVPLDKAITASTVIELALGALAFVAIVGFQISRTARSDYPTIRAVESLAFIVPVIVLLFATIYFLVNWANTASFGTPLSRTDTMYFSTTVLTTVGFGDISAKTELARVITTCQMMLDLVIVGLVVRLFVNAINVGRTRHVG
jgi:voltage-gated potassium channel